MVSRISLLLLSAIFLVSVVAVATFQGATPDTEVAQVDIPASVALSTRQTPTETTPSVAPEAPRVPTPSPTPVPRAASTPSPPSKAPSTPTSTPVTAAALAPTPEPAPPRTATPAPAPPPPLSTPTARPALPSSASLGRVVGSGCFPAHKEGDQWPETVNGVSGVVTCSNDYYYFRSAPPPAEKLFANTIVTFYGNRAAGTMGILGEHPLPELERRLRAQARLIDEVNGDAGVTLAFDYIYLVANDSAHPYAHYTPRMDLFEEALAFAEEKGFLFFFDLQFGYRDIETEVKKVLPYLLKPNVHLAVDTEFYMVWRKGVPGDTLGSMDAEDINKIAAIMQQYITENRLPDKILKVYQFDQVMLTNKDKLKVDTPNVRVLINADGVGFGGVEGKINDYMEYAEQPRNALGIKLFYRWDSRVLTPQELMALEPPPSEIVYQ